MQYFERLPEAIALETHLKNLWKARLFPGSEHVKDLTLEEIKDAEMKFFRSQGRKSETEDDDGSIITEEEFISLRDKFFDDQRSKLRYIRYLLSKLTKDTLDGNKVRSDLSVNLSNGDFSTFRNACLMIHVKKEIEPSFLKKEYTLLSNLRKEFEWDINSPCLITNRELNNWLGKSSTIKMLKEAGVAVGTKEETLENLDEFLGNFLDFTSEGRIIPIFPSSCLQEKNLDFLLGEMEFCEHQRSRMIISILKKQLDWDLSIPYILDKVKWDQIAPSLTAYLPDDRISIAGADLIFRDELDCLCKYLETSNMRVFKERLGTDLGPKGKRKVIQWKYSFAPEK